MKDKAILVGDVGGTNTRLGMARRAAHGWQLTQVQVLPTRPDTASLVRDYVRQTGPCAAAAFCGAGPLRPDGSLVLTNTDCTLDPEALGVAANLARASVINDFAAIAHAIPLLRAEDVRKLGGGTPDHAACKLVLGAGTGLGVAALAPNGQDWVVVSGEGGHVDLAPVSDAELRVWHAVRKSGRVCAETLLCGPGLEQIHVTLTPARPLGAEQIAAAAWSGDAAAMDAVRLFTRWLGRVAGNLALTFSAGGGIYIAGGIIPAWGERFDVAAFREGLEDHAPHRDWLAGLPVYIVTHPQPGLLGLAHLGSQRLKELAR